MNKITVTNKFGLIVLIIFFIIIYGYFNADQLAGDMPQPKNYIEDEAIIGDLGGYHILNDILFTDELSHYRISLHTSLNRPTTLDETIITPYTIAKQIIGSDKKYQIKITLNDTQVFDPSQDPSGEMLINKKIVVNEGPITEINTLKSIDDSITDIFINLDKKVKFKIDQNNTGTIFIDILK